MVKRLAPILLLLASLLWAGNSRAATPPNIVFILVDDLGYGDVGVFFQNLRRGKADRAEPWHPTPNLDAMAAEGVQLRHHYCPAPVCAPSRASLMLGVHQGHANVRDNQFDKALEDNHTLATVLRGAGYATAAIGKWGLQGGAASNDREVQAKMNPSQWPGYPTKRGFDFFHGYVRHVDGHAQYPKEDGKQVWENDREISANLAGCYTTDLFHARAKEWITRHHATKPGQPFFLYLAHSTPHAKLQLPPGPFPAGGGLHGGLRWLGHPGRMINTAAGKPDSEIHPDYAGATWDHDRDPATPERPWPDVFQRYASVVRRIDDGVGDLLRLLKDLGLDQNTLVVFTTDNGPSRESYLPEHFEPDFFDSFGPFSGIKRDVLEGGIRVGALARWPAGGAGGRISDSPSQFHDWLPTFAELAGVAAPARADGVSLVPTLRGEGVQKPSRVYVEYVNNQRTPGYAEFAPAHRGRLRNQMQAIREGEFVGVRHNIQNHTDPFEIYNIVADPRQETNLAPNLPALQQRMRDAVLRLRRPNPSAARPYDNVPMPAVAPARTRPGVAWSAHPKAAPWLARLEDVPPTASGVAETVGKVPAPPAAALLFRGLLEVPAPGEYTFAIPPGAVALLRIHDATVIDAGRAPTQTEVVGKVLLAAGRHPFRLYWEAGGPPPRLEIEGVSLPRQLAPSPMLHHE